MFPYRHEQSLRDKFHGRMIDVLNRGISGQEAPSELSRFESDVIGEAPVMVVWQGGTNAMFCVGTCSTRRLWWKPTRRMRPKGRRTPPGRKHWPKIWCGGYRPPPTRPASMYFVALR